MQQASQRKNTSPELQILKANPSLMPFLKEGDLVDVTLIENGNKSVFFEVPRVGTGVIYGIELINAKDILKRLNVGDSVTAKVVEPENADGFVELSLAEADKQKAWQEIKELKETDEPVEITITRANSGGLISEISGVQAFLPASQLSNDNYPKGAEGNRAKILEELEKFVGQKLSVKIISLNPRTNKLIVSEREVVAGDIKELLTKYKVGDVVSGGASGVANFGVFIRFTDEPKIEGLIHISELSHNVIEHPKEVISVGDMVQAQIVEIKDGRVSLSLKALKPNPWDKVGEKFHEGDVVDGVIHKLNPFGAFVKLDENITGLIHVSEFGSVEELKKHLEPGSTHKFLIDSIKADEKRIILKLTGSLKKAVPSIDDSEKEQNTLQKESLDQNNKDEEPEKPGAEETEVSGN
jgi:small subunit ribosomal protein S1